MKQNNLNQETKVQDAILIEGFSKKYFRGKSYAVKDLNFKVKTGEFHGFIGANGAGKTTTIKSIIGAYARFIGKIAVFGHKHSSIAAKKKIGYIPEIASFPKELNSIAYLTKMALLAGISKKSAKKFAKEKIEYFGLKKFARRKPNRLSSGQKKKLLLAQALVNNPDVIIMDEPAANLDPQARKDFFNILRNLQQNGKSIFISSHILVEIEKYIDSVTIIDEGEILYSGPINKIITKKENEFGFKFKQAKHQEIFVKHITKQGDDFTIVSTKEVVVKIKTQARVQTYLDIITTNKLEIEYVKENLRALQDVYDEYVANNKITKQKSNSKLLN